MPAVPKGEPSVGDKGPNRRWRLGEPNFPPEAIGRSLLSKLMGSRSRQTVRLLYAKSERIGLPKCTSLARSARQVSLVLLPAATRRASNQPRSAVVLGRNAQTAVVAGRFGERVKSTRSGSSGRSMSDRHGATRKFCTWQDRAGSASSSLLRACCMVFRHGPPRARTSMMGSRCFR